MADVTHKVADWLGKQGFPLEFKTAEVFARAGFETDQGAYVSDPKEQTLREIDVIASSVHVADGRVYRFSVVTECKWSQDRPWVIFTSRRARPSPAASIAYLLGSSFAEAVLWYLAADRQIFELHRNVMPVRVGFGGRQAFVEKNEKELFYPTMQSVVAAATAFSRSNEAVTASFVDIGRNFHVVIPTIVLDGLLFEAFLHGEELKVEPLTQAVVAWRGFGVRKQPVFANIVTVGALPSYAERYANYAESLRYWAQPISDGIAKAIVSKDPRELPSLAGPPADIVIPWLLGGMVG